jgi:hypothetical protein
MRPLNDRSCIAIWAGKTGMIHLSHPKEPAHTSTFLDRICFAALRTSVASSKIFLLLSLTNGCLWESEKIKLFGSSSSMIKPSSRKKPGPQVLHRTLVIQAAWQILTAVSLVVLRTSWRMQLRPERPNFLLKPATSHRTCILQYPTAKFRFQ